MMRFQRTTWGFFVSTLVLVSGVGCAGSDEPASSTSGMAGAAGLAGTGSAAGSAGASAGGGGAGGGGAGGGGAEGSTGPTCGSTLGGPTMVRLPNGVCIDSTEVTRLHYKAWLDSVPSTQGQPPECAWNDTFTPDCHWPPYGEESLPVVCVDWCDAFAYCKAVGKRLCGKVGGGESAWADYANAGTDEWYYACSSGGKNAYPYGSPYDAQACNGEDTLNEKPVSVMSMSGCQSAEPGFEGIYDLSGNVFEWVNSCDGHEGILDRCRARGGAFYDADNVLRCDNGGGMPERKIKYGIIDGVGIRCCKTAE